MKQHDPSGSTVQDIGLLLTEAVVEFKRQLHAHLSHEGFTDLGPSFGFVFRCLADRSMSLAELSALLGISPQGTLKIVAEMVDLGYVARKDDATDRRVRQLSLTARGRAALREARRFHATVEERLKKTVGAKALAAARAVLEELAGEPGLNEAQRKVSGRPF
jgi:DNA-binding MarR family transcriptional regulator